MTLKSIFIQFKYKICVTLFIVLLEGLLLLLFPLVIGEAINSSIKNDLTGIIQLGVLSFGVLFIGALRRFYDTRVYSVIFRKLAVTIAQKRKSDNTSENVAHVNLLTEIVDFFEHSIPELLSNLIGLFGTLFILLSLNAPVFFACLASVGIVYLVYLLSAQKTLKFNNNYNTELEEQVKVHNQETLEVKELHYRRLMDWKIKLSDLETLNFTFVWLMLSALLCFSVYTVVKDNGAVFGVIFSTVMYVYQFMESTINLPYYYQKTLRLKDISTRINNSLS